MKPDAELLSYLSRTERVTVRRAVPLSSLTTLGVGGTADLLLTPRDSVSAIGLLDRLARGSTPWRMLGGGSNTLASDRGYRGALVSCAGLDRLSVSDCHLRVGAGVLLSRAVNAAREAGLSGMEELYGIPGTVGGAVAGNAGAFGRSVSDSLLCATVYDPASLSVRVADREELAFGYRESALRGGALILLSACFRLAPSDRTAVGARMREVLSARQTSQPTGLPSAGCIFRRSGEGISSGELIDRAGLKGTRIGDAMISEVHAGFIVNLGAASSADVYALAETARSTVLSRFGIPLSYEIEFLGDIP